MVSSVEPAALALTIVALVVLSQHLATIDQSDYGRAIDFLLSGPSDGSPYLPMGIPTTEWAIRNGDIQFSQLSNSASLYFWLVAVAQRLMYGSFKVIALGAISKTLVILLAFGISGRLALLLDLGRIGRVILFFSLSACFFMAHNALFFNSFYQEHIMYLAIPGVLFGILDNLRWRRNTTIVIALALASTAKIQYFYFITVYLLIELVLGFIMRERLQTVLIAALIIVQSFSAFLITKNNDRDYNYYHSTYFGSYLFLTPAELDDLGVPLQNRRCIGVDAFGISLSGAVGEHEKNVGYTCYVHRSNVARTAVEPYLFHPSVLVRLWSFAVRAHWTVKYFLMDVDRPYIAPIASDTFGMGAALLWLTDVRDRWVSRSAGIICSVSLLCALGLAIRRSKRPLIAILLFLLLILASQVFVALIGEGMRDLSKHWAVAQLCLDLILVFTLAALVELMRPIFRHEGMLDEEGAAGA